VSWGAGIGEQKVLFTHLAVPVMTRLRQPERQVLDTLVDAGVARSRSEALAWAVRLVGEHTDEWLASLREAMAEVDKLRAQGPGL
jgi:Arc/MetJ-type ribon-helix-helix transcriptional regulator